MPMLTEADKRWMRQRHRKEIQDAHDRASLCREQFDEQLAEEGEISDDLHVDLAAAVFALYLRLRPTCTGNEEAEAVFPDDTGIIEHSMRPDSDVHPKEWAALFDALDGYAWRFGLIEVTG